MYNLKRTDAGKPAHNTVVYPYSTTESLQEHLSAKADAAGQGWSDALGEKVHCEYLGLPLESPIAVPTHEIDSTKWPRGVRPFHQNVNLR